MKHNSKKKDAILPSAGIEQNPLLSEVQKEFAGAVYHVGGKKVSEYRFYKTIADEISGKKKRQVFYWTDEKVLLLLKCLDIEITAETLAEFKAHFR